MHKKAKQNKSFALCLGSVFAVNLVLFFIKLFVGLSANSISIYSDSINSLFDSASALLTLIFVSSLGSELFSKKAEQLLSFIISCFICFSGAYFLYSSAERLMYPTPVWYNTRFLALLCFTCLAKLVLFFALRRVGTRNKSPVIHLMSTDSLLDFFISGTTVLTLLLSANGKYALDALCGIFISIVILINAAKSIIGSVKLLINFVSRDKRTKARELLEKCEAVKDIISLDFVDSSVCIAKVTFAYQADEYSEAVRKVCDDIMNLTEIKVFIVGDK